MKRLRERAFLPSTGNAVVSVSDVRECVEIAKKIDYWMDPKFGDDPCICSNCRGHDYLVSMSRGWCKDCEWEYWVGV